jgi:L,D-peptidoglycan transpeptidase YkuD (ErfK/YbiS/YcfS/YnhG family)
MSVNTRGVFAWPAACAWMLAMASPVFGSDVRSHGARQLVLVVTADWNAAQGVMRTYDWKDERWMQRSETVPVSIGRTGSAWGAGLHDAQPGLQKQEGDGRSPAGIFSIGTAFGYAAKVSSGLRYQPMTEFDYCIDVAASPHYNRIVDARKVGRAAVAQSTEPMRRDLHAQGDQRYQLGFVIDHNPRNVSMQGSCIFAHVWGSTGQATAGCTAMEDASMRDLLMWLDEKARPVFVLLPQPAYERLKIQWQLPDLAPAS